MRIIIDLQGAQTASRFRGIGRYSLSLALAMAKNSRSHEIWLALNGAFPESVLEIRRIFSGVIPQEHIRVFAVPTPVALMDCSNAWRVSAAEKIREHFLCQLEPDVIHVSSLFEGWVDDAVTSIGAFAAGANTAATLYDLIPLLHREIYLPDDAHQDYYFRKLQSLRNAGYLLAISEWSRSEAIDALVLPEERILNISAAIENRFRPILLSEERIHQLRRRYSIDRKLVTYVPGGFDMRKNVDGLIRAYALLPSNLRAEYQLVIVSKITDIERERLQQLRNEERLATDELVLTGYVSDEDLIGLYNLTTLFVFPSKHEGFGLPALEAMACGAPTIGSNTTSIPEAIGCLDALFDPTSVQSIANKIREVLINDGFRSQLRERELQQAKGFSWDMSAKRAIDAFEDLHSRTIHKAAFVVRSTRRPTLAYVSPLPPERSGISDYSAELLPELARHYTIEVIVAQQTISDRWVKANCQIRNVQWFKRNASNYERILYHFGNSPFHSHMFGLLHDCPGVVVLHDFFLSGVLAHDEVSQTMPGAWTNALYHSHGYAGLLDLYEESGFLDTQDRYPGNLDVLQSARGVIVHSEYSRKLAQHWYSPEAGKDWAVIPGVRTPSLPKDRLAARKALGIGEDIVVVCSFGFIGPNKCNHRLIDAWFKSRLGVNSRCHLIFVGENHGGRYGQDLVETIRQHGSRDRIRITGWVDPETFSNYLAAADFGVQLRTLSRGETSRALLDCMNYGLPTIANANGSTAEIPHEAVWMLPDEFTDAELVNALETLWHDTERRDQLGSRARAEVRANHNPALCADRYAEAIETIYQRAATDQHTLVKAIAASDDCSIEETHLEQLARSIASSSMPDPLPRQLLVDVSSIGRNDLKTGIERVVSSQLLGLIKNSPKEVRVEPIYLTDTGGQWHYRYARSYTCEKLGIDAVSLSDAPIDVGPGDVFYAADFCPNDIIRAARSNIYSQWEAVGLSINVLVYDLLPILRPEFFPDGANITHQTWLRTTSESASRLICISASVADELRVWLRSNPPIRNQPLVIDVVHLGADIAASGAKDEPGDLGEVLQRLRGGPIFLMVGTVEPRKGYLQTIAAFERLWHDGYQVNLVIVGKEGWTHLLPGQRRTIPEIVERLRKHPALGRCLFWLGGISDESLDKLYERADALLVASEGEGFGLPLIEAAQHGAPIIARDIPVFREVAGDKAYYFHGDEPERLAESLKEWLALRADGRVPQSRGMSLLTWEQSTKQLLKILLSNDKADGEVKPVPMCTDRPAIFQTCRG